MFVCIKKNIMRKKLLILAILHSSVTVFSQNICDSIGNDSLALYNNGYIVGPQAAGSFPINTETKWINTNGVDSLFINTMQHRLYDSSKIYDENNNLIWTWGGTTVPSITWYSENHSLFIGGNDSVRIEFYQGYTNFSVGHLQIIGISCTSSSTSVIDMINSTFKVYPNPTLDNVTIEFISLINKDFGISIVNVLGNRIFEERLYDFNGEFNKKIRLSEYKKGIYFILIESDNGVINKKLILQ
jgi:hypothetical protein|tara:strand:+ start:226 stop:954 length:729 start_codon:yes stop_codon:yes gene_type:complete